MDTDDLPIVKVCTHTTCANRGSCALYQQLRAELHGEALVREYTHCFDACEDGPNVTVNGELLRHVRGEGAAAVIRRRLSSPSLKSDGRGTRPWSDIDRVIDNLTEDGELLP